MKRIISVIIILIESLLMAYFLLTNISSYYSAYITVKRGAHIYQFVDTLVLSESVGYRDSSGNESVLTEGTEIEVYGLNDKGCFMQFRPNESEEEWDSSRTLTVDMVKEKARIKDVLKQLKAEKKSKLDNLLLSSVLVYALLFILSLGLFVLINILFKKHIIPHCVILIVLIVCAAFFSPIFLAR